MSRQYEWRQRIERIAQRFLDNGATSQENAATTHALGLSSKFEVAMGRRLGRLGIFVKVEDHKYYLDASRLQELVRRPEARPEYGAASNWEERSILDFDGHALFEAMNARRISEGLSWPQVADEIWKLSSGLNNRRHDHPISPSTITSMSKRGNTSCQHALFFLRWLGRSPESFLADGRPKPGKGEQSLPRATSEERLRWDLRRLYEVVNARRQELKMTWPEVAAVIHCTPAQLIGLRTVRFAIGMNLTMKIVQWLERPAADFIYRAQW